MKFGIIKYSGYDNNIGDYMQQEGLIRAYERMGISSKDMIEIEQKNLGVYEGEYVVFPISGFFSHYCLPIFPLSPKIIPVFISFCTGDEDIAHQVAAYSKFAPIGCRDLCTMNLLRKEGADAYVSGCLSIGYQKREISSLQKDIYLCDVPENLFPYIPEKLLKDAKQLPVPYRKMAVEGFDDRNAQMSKNAQKEVVEEVRDHAALVITRRLHLALPCLAMGIPVILAHESNDVEENRFAGLDKLIHVYKKKEYDNIDWNPQPVDIEAIKEMTISYAVEALSAAQQKYEKLCALSDYYESTPIQIYYEGMKSSYLSEQKKFDYIKESWKLERTIFEVITKTNFEDMHLIFYGAGDKAHWATKRYSNYIRRAKKVSVVDGNPDKQGKAFSEVFPDNSWELEEGEEQTIQSPDIIDDVPRDKLVVIVAVNSYYQNPGASIGNYLIQEFGLKEGRNFFFLDKLNNTMDMHLSETSTPLFYLQGF